MTRRFLVPPPLPAGDFELPADEAAHLATVLRARPGETIELTDGAGREASATVVAIGRRTATVRVDEAVRRIPRPPALELWCALPRAGAADDVVRQATEVGATMIRPLLTERGVWRSEPDRDDRRHDRFAKAAAAALKQCKGAWSPEFAPPLPPSELKCGSGDCAIFGSLREGVVPLKDAAPRIREAARVIVLVGPEGGFTEAEERAMVSAGATAVRLGRHVLRIETAVVALLGFAVAARG